jgi:TM2 domain-containing membrane protein YozV
VKPQTELAAPAAESQTINLRDPYLAAFLAWLIPGAGHFYQRRWGKGGLFMVCILGTFFAGLVMGHGRVVYASWRQNDQRFYYAGQVCVGLPAMPALVQSLRLGADPPKAPLWGGFMAPPLLYGQAVPGDWAASRVAAGEFDETDFPNLNLQSPAAEVNYIHSPGRDSPTAKAFVGGPRDPYNQLSDWNLKMGAFFELGSVYTLIAGLLNVLAIYDAWGGPVAIFAPSPSPEKKEPAAA